jgi:universal stress protein A
MLTLKTLLVAVDFSDTSADAVRYAQELARSFDAQLHLLHVVPDPLQQPWAVEAPGLDFPGLADQWRTDAQERLRVLGASTGLDPERTVLSVGTGVPHRVIVEYATEHAADLVVLGSHGHGPVVHFLLGSVAERVVRQAVCPVLIVPHLEIRRSRRSPRHD